MDLLIEQAREHPGAIILILILVAIRTLNAYASKDSAEAKSESALAEIAVSNTKRIDRMDTYVEKMEDERRNLLKQVQELSDEVANARKELSGAKDEARKVESLQSQLDVLSEKVAILEGKLKEKDAETERITKERDDLKMRLDKLVNDYSDLVTQHKTLQDQFDMLLKSKLFAGDIPNATS